jgi:hypothetical protein
MKKSMIFVMAITAGLFFGAAHGAAGTVTDDAGGLQAVAMIKVDTLTDATFPDVWTNYLTKHKLPDTAAKRAFIEQVIAKGNPKLNDVVRAKTGITAKDCGLTDKDADKETIKRLRPALKGEGPFGWMADHKVATGLIAGGTIAVIIGSLYAAKKYGVFGAKKDATSSSTIQDATPVYS